MNMCGQSFDAERATCIVCSNFEECDTNMCLIMLKKAKTEEEKDYYNSRIADNKGG